ncbi:uncharacterized protein B0I36DRAFT_358893 [Microdochium trichocladiopsis]|uniref:Uncharacterized protein n=1 Tax=Microdochium trichocladiopsis TaxID=1682393 RepID=A0A9P8YFQ2_9PEZI|nr:uncharacterized protein B0I36DRAFT_358893 [Microdochium trichocladiopsis]KAH7037149.1 hypothetical protein B0I36DRAFT_358893 [Microdochium trichocladiopsis]
MCPPRPEDLLVKQPSPTCIGPAHFTTGLRTLNPCAADFVSPSRSKEQPVSGSDDGKNTTGECTSVPGGLDGCLESELSPGSGSSPTILTPAFDSASEGDDNTGQGSAGNKRASSPALKSSDEGSLAVQPAGSSEKVKTTVVTTKKASIKKADTASLVPNTAYSHEAVDTPATVSADTTPANCTQLGSQPTKKSRKKKSRKKTEPEAHSAEEQTGEESKHAANMLPRRSHDQDDKQKHIVGQPEAESDRPGSRASTGKHSHPNTPNMSHASHKLHSPQTTSAPGRAKNNSSQASDDEIPSWRKNLQHRKKAAQEHHERRRQMISTTSGNPIGSKEDSKSQKSIDAVSQGNRTGKETGKAHSRPPPRAVAVAGPALNNKKSSRSLIAGPSGKAYPVDTIRKSPTKAKGDKPVDRISFKPEDWPELPATPKKLQQQSPPIDAVAGAMPTTNKDGLNDERGKVEKPESVVLQSEAAVTSTTGSDDIAGEKDNQKVL